LLADQTFFTKDLGELEERWLACMSSWKPWPISRPLSRLPGAELHFADGHQLVDVHHNQPAPFRFPQTDQIIDRAGTGNRLDLGRFQATISVTPSTTIPITQLDSLRIITSVSGSCCGGRGPKAIAYPQSA
jgi:hypothetical protein